MAPAAPPDETGALAWPDPARSVRDTIRAILSTRPGEQLMRPDFGAGIDRLLHAPNDLATRRRLRDGVRESLARWERRILLDAVEVWEVEASRASCGWKSPTGWRAPAHRRPERDRATGRLTHHADPAAFAGRQPLRRPRRGPDRTHPGAHARMDQPTSGRPRPHPDRPVRVAGRRLAVPRQPDPGTPAPGVPEAAGHGAETGSAGPLHRQPGFRPRKQNSVPTRYRRTAC